MIALDVCSEDSDQEEEDALTDLSKDKQKEQKKEEVVEQQLKPKQEQEK